MNTKTATIKGLELFDTSNVNEMQHMFKNTNLLSLDLSCFDISKATNMADMFGNVSAIVGYTKDEGAADKFNDSSVTGIPSTLKFVVK